MSTASGVQVFRELFLFYAVDGQNLFISYLFCNSSLNNLLSFTSTHLCSHVKDHSNLQNQLTHGLIARGDGPGWEAERIEN
jgi:hypothetical protein